jgi:hypothetical protein
MSAQGEAAMRGMSPMTYIHGVTEEEPGNKQVLSKQTRVERIGPSVLPCLIADDRLICLLN